MEAPQFISHLKQLDNGKWVFQSNEEHEKGVAQLAEKFSSAIGCRCLGHILGSLHDLGKEQMAFQRYIRKVSGYDALMHSAPKTPHAYVGALVAKQLYPQLFPVLSYPIASHHTGLEDFDDFKRTMENSIPEDVHWKDLDKTKVELPTFYSKMRAGDANHVLRLLFSCLVDADYLDTELFMNPEKNRLRQHKSSLENLLPLLENHLKELSRTAAPTELNRLRGAIQNICKERAEEEPGFYSLTVPTGGGKTLSSVLWALHHAIKHHKDRIIIAIPYTSIVVQTAATLRRIFGDGNVCEHHSNFDPEKISSNPNNEDLRAQRLATENWDYPIVVTTNVQLFESMFSNKPSACRKLHNLANSVIILDEVQTLPLDYLQPIVDGLECYVRLFGMSVLFTTASQPALRGEHRGCSSKTIFYGLSTIKELIPQEWRLHEKLRRVSLHFDTEQSNYDDIAQRLANHDRVLCIVNTRKDAEELFKRLPQEGQCFHLSKNMCPVHIQETIETIRTLLRDSSQSVIRVVATQLIEAGVDIDFPVVYRQEAGLDSILQAAGRCNREGRLGVSNTYVFRFNHPLPKGYINKANDARQNLVGNPDWFAPDTMNSYFIQLYAKYESFDAKGVKDYLRDLEPRFKTAAEAFRLIENKGYNVIVNYENSCEIVEAIKKDGLNYDISKKVSKFMVNINQQNFKKLLGDGFIEEIIEGIYFLPDREQYDAKTGITTENHWLDEILIQ